MSRFFLVLIITALLVPSLYYLLIIFKSRKDKRIWLLLLLRALSIILLATALYQPLIHISSIVNNQHNTAVLIDASKSMQMFNAGESLQKMKTIFSDAIKEKDNLNISFFLFGDSLRSIKPEAPAGFFDNKSFLPINYSNRKLSDANRIILLSDGNFTNPSIDQFFLKEHDFYYLPLDLTQRRPFLTAGLEKEAGKGSSVNGVDITLNIEGYKKDTSSIKLSISESGSRVYSKIIQADTGYFNIPLQISLPEAKTGIHVYKLTAKSGSGSLSACSYFYRENVPGRYFAGTYSSNPSLDKRFVINEFTENPSWQIDRHKTFNGKMDAFILFDFDDKAEEIVNNLPKDVTLIYCSTLPCKNVKSLKPSAFTPELSISGSGSDLKSLSELPPPESILICDKPVYNNTAEYITDTEKGNNRTPVFFSAVYKNRRCLFIAAQGIWRWLFWPYSHHINENSFLFTNLLFQKTRNLIQFNRNNRFLAYPLNSPVTETDTISFKIFLPASFSRDSLINLSSIITGRNGETVIDTIFEIRTFGSRINEFSLAPLDTGSYYYTLKAASDKDEHTFSDSLVIFNDQREYLASSQNSMMLDNFAASVFLTDSSKGITLKDLIYNDDFAQGPSTVKNPFQIKHSWWLLLIMILCLSTEWTLRKLWNFD